MRHGNNVSKPEQLLQYLYKKKCKWPLIHEVIIVNEKRRNKKKLDIILKVYLQI